MSLLRTSTSTFTRTLPCVARAFSSYRGVKATLKDAANAVDHTAAQAALKGLEAAEQVRNAVGTGTKEATRRAAETGGWAAGTAKEYGGKAKEAGGKAVNEYSEAAADTTKEYGGMAKEAAGRAARTGGWAAGTTKEYGGKAKEVGGKAANEYSEAAAGKADELAGKAKGAYNESKL